MLWLFAMGYAIVENCYFGWNPWPKSDAELIADGICVLLFAVAYVYRKPVAI